MGANNSTEANELKKKEEQLQNERRALEAEKQRLRQQHREHLEAERQRLQQQALQQQWEALRLQEEQRHKEAAEKWRREKQQKDAYAALQRQVEELKIQQEKQLEEQKTCQQQASAPLPTTSREFVDTKETVSTQQRVSPNLQGNETPSNMSPSPSVLSPIESTQPTTSQTPLDANAVIPKQQKSLSQAKPQKKKKPETRESRMNASDVRYKELSAVDYVSKQNCISKATAENIIKLLDEENTIPFIVQYRECMTQKMSQKKLRAAKDSYDRVKSIKKKIESIIKDVEKKGNWTPQFEAFVQSSQSLEDLNYIHSIFKVTNTRNIELENIAEAVITGKTIAPLLSFVNPTSKGLANEETVKDGIVYIVADTMNKDKRVFDILKKLKSKYSINVETKFTAADPNVETMDERSKRQRYAEYDNFVSTENALRPSEISFINRGEAQKILSVKITIPKEFHDSFKDRYLQSYAIAATASELHRQLINAAFDYMWNTWIKQFIEKRTRDEMNKKAENDSMEFIVENIEKLLFTIPMKGKGVISIISISQSVCKVAAISEEGILLACDTIHPHDKNNPSAVYTAETTLVRMVHKYNCTVFAVSNGTTGTTFKQNIHFIEKLIKKKAFGPVEVAYAVVDSAGLSFYVRSAKASSEFPRIDENIVAAVSIARRLQDPIAELVKIEPIHLAPELLAQEIPKKQLIAKLDAIFMEVVSLIGVDVNTASADRLRRVAGLDEAKAKSIVEWRQSSGPFKNRRDLLKVKGIGNKTFEQCAGFIRIIPETAVGIDGQRPSQDSLNCLDQTRIHPESYDTAIAFLKAAKCNVNQLGSNAFIFAVKLFANQDHEMLAKKFDTTKYTIELMIEAFTGERTPNAKATGDGNVNTITSSVVNPKSKPNLPIENREPKPKTKRTENTLGFDNLVLGTVLTGVVVDIRLFGAFTSVGVGIQGLIHKRHMNGMTLTVGQRVETVVNTIDRERRIFSLRLIRCI